MKARRAVAAGASAVVIANALGDEHLLRAPCAPRWEGFDVPVPVLLVSAAAGDALERALQNEPSRVSVTPSGGAHAAAWAQLAQLADSTWPQTAEARQAQDDELEQELAFAEWPERKEWLHAKRGGL